MLRILFMGTPHFSIPTLEALHRHHSIVGVYTQPDKPVGRGLDLQASPIKQKAMELGLPVFQPEKLTQPGEYEKLQALNADAIVVVAYGQILKRNVLDLPLLGCINIHSSLLPRWRGAAPIQWALMGGDAETGITTMHMAEKLDAGDILLQKSTPITPEDTTSSLHERLAQIGAELILPTLAGLESKALKGQVQDESKITYAAKLTKAMEWLDPTATAVTLDLRIRALNPWPGTSLRVGERLRIKKAQLRKNIHGKSGSLFEQNGMLLLGTSQGSLELQILQWEGKKEVGAAEFLNGLRGRNKTLPLTIEPPPSLL